VKILLDECLDRRLAKEIVGYKVKTVPQMNWAGIKNGELMRLAEKIIDRTFSKCRNTHGVSVSLRPYFVRASAKKMRKIEILPNLEKGKAKIISIDK